MNTSIFPESFFIFGSITMSIWYKIRFRLLTPQKSENFDILSRFNLHIRSINLWYHFVEVDFADQTFYAARVYYWNHRSNRSSMDIFKITVKTAGLLIGKRANLQSES